MLGNLSSCIHVYVTFKYATHLKMIADHAPSPLLQQKTAHQHMTPRHIGIRAQKRLKEHHRDPEAFKAPQIQIRSSRMLRYKADGVVVTPVLILWLINV